MERENVHDSESKKGAMNPIVLVDNIRKGLIIRRRRIFRTTFSSVIFPPKEVREESFVLVSYKNFRAIAMAVNDGGC